MKKFDLNIDRMLENWDVFHAIREIIANALDEQILTGTPDITISRNSFGDWCIRDFGRGLRHEHFTMNENQEKLNHPCLIGKFGVGLKDALATFDRLGIDTRIRSKFCDVSFDRTEKHDFSDVITLHACISEPSDPTFTGTEFILTGCSDNDIENAKKLFLCFSGETSLESTQYGEVLRKLNKTSYIYINGIRVAEEDNFLFSYNITSLTATIKKALNRERTNVGRVAYSDRIKSILLASSSEVVAKALVNDLSNFGSGTLHDEMKWTDVSVHASKITNVSGNVLFLTDEQIMNAPRFVEEAQANGRQIITIPNNVKEKLTGQVDTEGNAIQDLDNFVTEWNDCFEFEFVAPEQLSQVERSVFNMTEKITNLIGGLPSNVQSVNISDKMRPETGGFSEALGLWTGSEIIIKRSELTSIERYASTLLHEIAHARSGESDITIGFEQELTSFLGIVASKALHTVDTGFQLSDKPVRTQNSEIRIVSDLSKVSRSESKKKLGFWGWLSDVFSSPPKDYEVGFKEEFSSGFFTQLIYKRNGWYLWKTVSGDSISLMLAKSAIDGTTPPKPSGLVWCFGDLGFYAHRTTSSTELYASFYGKYQFSGGVKCVFNDNLYTSLTESNLLTMEGATVRFEVTSSPRHYKSAKTYQQESSSIDFSGVGDALKKLNSEYQTLIVS